jgi:hypothetical protein
MKFYSGMSSQVKYRGNFPTMLSGLWRSHPMDGAWQQDFMRCLETIGPE